MDTHRRRARTTAAVLALLAGAALLPAAAGADTVIDADTAPDLRADAGYVAWPADGGFAVRRSAGGTIRTVAVPGEPGTFDVGRGPAGGALIAWVDRCSRAARLCTVKAVPAAGGTARVLARLPYAGVEEPHIALDGTRLLFTTAARRGGRRCDGLHVRGLGAGGRTRALATGLRCGVVLDVEAEGRWAAFEIESGLDALDSEVRAVRTAGGPSVRVDYAGSAESLEYLDGLAMDGGLIYTTHLGNRREHFVRRVDPETGRGSDALAFAHLGGGFARDRGRQFARQNATTVVDPIDGEFGTNACIASFAGPACLLVAQDDPWAGRRRLLPQVTLVAGEGTLAGGGAATVLSGRVTRRTADRRRRGAAVPVAGARVTVARRVDAGPDEDDVAGELATARTDAAGRWTATVPAEAAVTYRAFAAVAGVGAPVGSDELTLEG